MRGVGGAGGGGGGAGQWEQGEGGGGGEGGAAGGKGRGCVAGWKLGQAEKKARASPCEQHGLRPQPL